MHQIRTRVSIILILVLTIGVGSASGQCFRRSSPQEPRNFTEGALGSGAIMVAEMSAGKALSTPRQATAGWGLDVSDITPNLARQLKLETPGEWSLLRSLPAVRQTAAGCAATM